MSTAAHQPPTITQSRSRVALALTLAAGAGTSCANSRETKLRADWDGAEKAAAVRQGDDDDPNNRSQERDDETLASWRTLTTFLDTVVSEVSLGLATVSIERLTTTLCAEPPDIERAENDGPRVFHCTPAPPQTIHGHAMTLEFSETGTIGLVITDLADKASRKLLADTREHIAAQCVEPLTRAIHADDATEEFYTCSLREGPTLAIGRFPTETSWQFSLVVLIPG
jgi:hypothetical protein